MNLERKKIEELISTSKLISSSQIENKNNLLFKINDENENDLWNSLLDDDVLQDPQKSYELFYKGIQSFIMSIMPKGEIRTIVLELKTIMLTGKEKSNIKYGKRGADSRMAKSKEMEAIIESLTKWSSTPQDYYKLATILLEKNIELGYCPLDRSISDFI
jgi:hypothetical protein